MRKIFKVMPIYLILIFLSVFVIKTEIIKAEDSDFTIKNGVLTKYTGTEENVVIPNSVTEIGESAFAWCGNLKNIEIPNSVTKIGDGAFLKCSNLSNIEIPNSVTEIGESAFFECSNLSNIEISNSVTEIGYRAFCNCSNLSSIKIPNSVTEIGYKAFEYCSNLSNIEIPNSVTKIGDEAFYKCENLSNIEIPNSVTKIGYSAFEYCSNLSNIEIPNSVTEIGYRAFCNCSNLSSIKIPNSVTEIGYKAFEGCSNLSNIEISNSVTIIDSYMFADCSNLSNIEIPNSVTKIGYKAFEGCSNLSNIEIPNSVTEIGNSAFSECSNLSNIEISNSVTIIGDETFYKCSNLSNIEIPNSVTIIGDEAFGYCWNLSNIEIPNSVTKIGYRAFEACSDLSNIEIPNSVTEIGNFAFKYCSNLSNIEIPNSVTEIGNSAFEDCRNLSNIEIPNSVTKIGDGAFVGCSNNLIIYGEKSSYAEQYANENGIEFREITNKDEIITKYTKANEILEQLNPDDVLGDVKISAETVEGVFVNIPFIGEFPLIRFNAEMDIKLGDKVQAKVNTESKKIEILVGFKDFSGSANISAENQSTNYWSESYKEVKSLYTGMTGKKVNSTKLWNDFSKLRGKLKKVDGKMVVNGNMQIAGYMEFDYSSGTIQYSEGGLILETSLGARTDIPIPEVPIVYLSFGITGSADGGFYIVKTSEHYDISANLGLALKLDARVGLGSKKANLYIDGGVQGSINANVKFPASKLKDALELYLTGGLVLEYNVFGVFHDTKSKDFVKIELFPNQKIVNIASLDLNNDLEMISRDYLSKSKIKLFNNDKNSFKKDDVFPYNLVNLVKLDNGQLLLIWLDDDTTKSLANRTSLMYSLYNGNSWSEPEFIEKTKFANYSPEIYTINNKVYLLWQKSNKVFDDNINVNDIPENIDLVYSVFENGKFSKPINLNEAGNKNYEMMQTIASDGKNVCVAWVENADNSINFSSNKYSIHLKEFDGNNWQQEKEIESNIDNISLLNLEYINNKPVVFYGLSKNDNDLQDIYMYKDNVSQKLLQDCKLTKILDKNLYYIYNSTLYCYDLNTNKKQSLGINIDYDYDILKYKNKTYIFYTIFNNFRTELVMRVYDLSLNEWSDEIKLTNYDKYIRNYSPIIDENGKLTVALNIAEVNDDKKEDGIYGKTTLNVIDINKIVDLQIGDYIYYDYSLVSPNAELPLTFTIKNVGTEKVNNVDVIIYDADSNILQKGTIECEIQVGEEREVVYNYKLPENIKYGDIKLELDIKGDIDKSNNSFTTKIGYADICLNDLIIEGTGNNAKIKGSVSNIGYNEAKNVNVNLYKNNITGDKISTKTFSNINVGETKDFEVQLPEELFNLTNNTISNIVYIETVTDTQESITTNNDSFISIEKPEEMGIILNKQKESLNIGETKKLYITYNEIASSSEEVWSSDNDKIVSVDEKGNITAKSSGTANITVEKNNKKAVCIVEVGEDVKVSSIKFDTNFENLFLGDTKQLKATILPSEAKNKKIIWTTSDDTIASVDDNGLVTAKSNGLVDIIATTVDGNKSTICKFKVYSNDNKLDEDKPSDNKPEDNKPEDNKPEDNKPSDNKPEDNKPEDNKPSDNKPEDNKPSDNKPEDNKLNDNKPEDNKPEDNKSEDNKSEDNKPSDNKPEDNKPSDNKPEDNKPSEDKPSDNKPDEDKPEDNKPEDNKPSEDNSNDDNSNTGDNQDNNNDYYMPDDDIVVDDQETIDNNNDNTGDNRETVDNDNTGNNQSTVDNNNGNTGNNQSTADNNNENTEDNQEIVDNNNTTSKDKKVLCYITYKLKSGKNNPENLNFYEQGENVQLQPAHRKGYKFVGWYTEKSCNNKVSNIVIEEDTTLYVKWEEIVVKTPTIKSLKALGDKKLKFSFKKDKTLDGYEIVYSTDMKFKNKQTKLIDNKTTYTLSNLDTGKYAIKVRGYIIDSAGKKVYSKYTKAKKINIK